MPTGHIEVTEDFGESKLSGMEVWNQRGTREDSGAGAHLLGQGFSDGLGRQDVWMFTPPPPSPVSGWESRPRSKALQVEAT